MGKAGRFLVLASTADLMNITDEMGLTQLTSVKGTARTLVHSVKTSIYLAENISVKLAYFMPC